MDQFELESKYLKAKQSYYRGEPVMSDEEFDVLEETLKNINSEVVKLVGSTDRRFKHHHLSPMCSLEKIQTHYNNDDIEIPWHLISAWFSKFPNSEFEATPKFDGIAVNIIYSRKHIKAAITRGDKMRGMDVTNKLLRLVPLMINEERDIEVRGEVVIPIDIFNEKYANHSDENMRKYKNPRNFVAGIINRDDVAIEILNDLKFIPVEVRIHENRKYEYPEKTIDFLNNNDFSVDTPFTFFGSNSFKQVYNEMKNYRENECKYQLDGFVIKAPENLRDIEDDNNHNPEWAIAIKFPPKKAITTIVGLTNNVSITGENIPGIQLKEVYLDGSTIRNTAGFNWGHIINNGLYPGAEVEIAKSGDIIPIITKIIKPVFTGTYPEFCECGSKLHLDNIHLMCTNNDCTVKKMKRFISGLNAFDLDKFGDVTKHKLFKAGFTEIKDIFDPEKFNRKNLVKTGHFKYGKTLNSLLEEIEKIKVLELDQIILSLEFEGVGRAAAAQLARYITNQKYSFSGLERVAVEGFEEGSEKRNKIEELIEMTKKRKIRIKKIVDLKDFIGYEMTGRVKIPGFKSKKNLENFLESYGYAHVPIKDAKILLTASLKSFTSKMKQAKERGIAIYEYETFVKMLKDNVYIDL